MKHALDMGASSQVHIGNIYCSQDFDRRMRTRWFLQCWLSSQDFVEMAEGADRYNYGNWSNDELMCILTDRYSLSEPMANNIPIARKTLSYLRSRII